MPSSTESPPCPSPVGLGQGPYSDMPSVSVVEFPLAGQFSQLFDKGFFTKSVQTEPRRGEAYGGLPLSYFHLQLYGYMGVQA